MTPADSVATALSCRTIKERTMIDLQSMQEKQRKFAKYRLSAIANPTKAEAMVKLALESLGLKFRFQKGFLRDNTIRLVDFYISKFGICLEVDGKYHELQKEYDQYREGRIKSQRKKKELIFVRVTNEWVFEQENLAESLSKVIYGAVGRDLN